MSNLYTYFQRIGDKKMPATTADKPASQLTPKNESKATKTKSMNMDDVYSADSPKSEKRKQADDNNETPVSKTKSTLIKTFNCIADRLLSRTKNTRSEK